MHPSSSQFVDVVMIGIQFADVVIFSAISTLVGAGTLLWKRAGKADKAPIIERKLRVRRDQELRLDPSASIIQRFDHSLESTLIRGGVPWNSNTCALFVGCAGLLAAGIACALGMHLVLQFAAFVAVVFLGLLGFYLNMSIRLRIKPGPQRNPPTGSHIPEDRTLTH